MSAPPDELVALQRRFSASLRRPIGLRGGRPGDDDASRDDAAALGIVAGCADEAARRLGTYRRQGWLRLFAAFRTEFPLASRVVGLPGFLPIVEAFLLAHPPRTADLHRVADGFVAWWGSRSAGATPCAERDPFVDALAIDEAFRSLLRSPSARPFAPSPERVAALAGCRLVLARGARLVDDGFGLVRARRAVASDASVATLALPSSPRPTSVLLVRTDDGILEWELDPDQARFFRGCVERSVGDALVRLEAERPSTELGANVRAWLARAGALGVFDDLVPADPP